MEDFINNCNDVLNAVLTFVLQFLPESPFKNIKFPPEMDFFLGVLNYYVPFKNMLILGASWVGCIAIFYTYQLILRNAKAIK